MSDEFATIAERNDEPDMQWMQSALPGLMILCDKLDGSVGRGMEFGRGE